MPTDTNTSSRIAMLSKSEARDRGVALGIDEYVAQLNLFRILLHYPEVAAEINKTIFTLMSSDGALSHRLRELIIMRVAWLSQSKYEWTQHWHASLFLGLTEPELVAVRDWKNSDLFDATDRIVLQATDDTLGRGGIQPTTWARLAELLPEPSTQITVVASIGNWHMAAQIMESLDIPLEDDAVIWPPDGVAPNH